MKKLWLLYLVLFIAYVEARCPSPPSGPPGAPGLVSTTAFGSFYATDSQRLNGLIDPIVSFPSTQSALNIPVTTSNQFTIQESGFYYIQYGVSNSGVESNETAFTLKVDGVNVAGSRLYVGMNDHLISIAVIIPILTGQVVTVENDIAVPVDTGLGDNSGVTAFIDLIRLTPLII